MSETTTLRPGYEKPENKSFPQDWKVSQLYEACTFHQGGKLGITKSAGYVASGVPAYSAAGQDGYVGQVEFSNTDGVVLSAIGANCGRCFFASGNWTTLANVQAIIPSPSQLDAKYLYYRVNRESYWPRSGSAQPFIKPSDVRNCWVAHPPIDQQKIIASILDTLNTQIQKTEALIAKLEKVKEGLLHDLLTRGIDDNGQLRPSPEQAPELYKESPLGLIPREWEVVSFLDAVDFPSGQVSPLIEPYASLPLVAPDHIEAGTSRLIRVETAREQGAISGKYIVRPGDVVYSKIRPYLKKAWLAEIDSICSADMYPLSPKLLTSAILLRIVMSENFSTYANAASMRTGIPKINREELAGYTFALPTMQEQVRMENIFQEIERRAEKERETLCKLVSEKNGLMDDLLTGRVRVTPLLGQAQQATSA